MALGLSSTLSKTGFTNPVAGIVTDSLVLKHNYAAGGVVPVSDGAALFDASSEVITCGNDTSMDITDDITMTAWVNPTTAGQMHILLAEMMAQIEIMYYMLIIIHIYLIILLVTLLKEV